MSRRLAILGAVMIVAAFAWGLWPYRKGEWKREHPLINPIGVASVKNGVIELADGRRFLPAGIERLADVPLDEYDAFLRVAAVQGVVVRRDLGDGRAFLIVEPKFYNWCGTSADRWPGSYIQCPLSETAVWARYAAPRLDEVGLTSVERWRLEGTAEVMHPVDWRVEPNAATGALRFEGMANSLDELDELIELMWKPPPDP